MKPPRPTGWGKRPHKRGRRTTELRALAQERFHGCEACRPNHAFEFLNDVLSPLSLTPAEERRLSRALWCPYCETILEDFHFDKVMAYTETEWREMRRHQSFHQRFRSRFDAFSEFIVRNPLLGGLHPMGIRLARAVRQTPYIALEPSIWFRARRGRDIPGETTEQDVLPADPRKVSLGAGRFNSPGQLGYYLADSQGTAAGEVLPYAETIALMHDRDPQLEASDVSEHLGIPPAVAEESLRERIDARDGLVIGRISITAPVRVLDLRVSILGESPIRSVLLEGLVHTGALRRPTDYDDKSLPQYRVPQYIADLVRHRGLAGIVYSSSRGLPPEFPATNLVLFRVEDGMVKAISIGRYRWRGLPESDSLMDVGRATVLEEVRS